MRWRRLRPPSGAGGRGDLTKAFADTGTSPVDETVTTEAVEGRPVKALLEAAAQSQLSRTETAVARA